MATVTNADIQAISLDIQVINPIAECNGTFKTPSASPDSVTIIQYDTALTELFGKSVTYSLLLSTSGSTKNPFFHEACVYLPKHDELYITSNLLQSTSSSNFPTILISRVKLHRKDDSNGESYLHAVDWVKMRPPPGIDMPNGGVNYKDGILFCSQGSPAPGTGGIYYMPRGAAPKAMVTNFHGRDFNSVNDVVVAKDGAIWFTDPCYGYGQDFRQRPSLPSQVYRFLPDTGEIRVVADGFSRPNGIAFCPEEKTCYVTDTGLVKGDGEIDPLRPATVYAFDIVAISGAPFLTNRRVFAFAAAGIPDGIKCDIFGNVYSGCGDGVEVWNPAGRLIGRILVAGGVANFCFGKDGEMFLCNEQKLWRVQMAKGTKGALLGI